jgi:hypothetical protein
MNLFITMIVSFVVFCVVAKFSVVFSAWVVCFVMFRPEFMIRMVLGTLFMDVLLS